MRHLRSHLARILSLACALVVAGGPSAMATQPASSSSLAPTVAEGDRVDELPRQAQGIGVDERVGETVPLDLAFRDADGKEIKLGDLLDGELPIILTFNYSTCPMLCSAQLMALTEGMREISFTAGEQYRIITVGIDPQEEPAAARATRDRYIAGFPADKQASIRAGWHFLTGAEPAIKALADAVGFHYRYLEDEKEYSHPASLIFLSPQGVVTRYYHGIYYEPDRLSASIFKAGVGEHGVSLGFLLACFRPSHDEGYAAVGESAMRYGALVFVVFMLAAFGAWQMTRARSARQE